MAGLAVSTIISSIGGVLSNIAQGAITIIKISVSVGVALVFFGAIMTCHFLRVLCLVRFSSLMTVFLLL